MKTKKLDKIEIKKRLAQALEILTMIKSNRCLQPSQTAYAIGYGPWRGLGQTAGCQAEEILPILLALDQGHAAFDGVRTEIENACGSECAPAHDPRRLLLKVPELIPYFLAMASLEKWDFQAVFISRKVKVIPPPPGENKFADLPAKGVDYQAPRVDRAVEFQLGPRLSLAANITDWRLYTSIIGLRCFSELPTAESEQISDGKIIPGYAYERYGAEKRA